MFTRTGAPRAVFAAVTLLGIITNVTSATNNTKPMYRFWHQWCGGHFMTINEAEKNNILQNYCPPFLYEGVAMNCFEATGTTLAGLHNVYRFWRYDSISDHFYTIDDAEAQFLRDNYAWLYQDQGVAFRAYPADYAGRPATAKPVWRLYHPTMQVHMYTLDQAEREYDISMGYIEEGIAWYAFDVHVSSAVRCVYTTGSYGDTGTDGYPGLTDGQVHFGSAIDMFPNVHLKVTGTGGCPLSQNEACFWIGTGGQWANPVEAKFLETAAGSGIYKIVSPLHVAPEASQANLQIKIVDEDTIYVDGKPGPKVDRGEVATITAPCWDPDVADDTADVINHCFNKDDGSHSGSYYWWSTGQARRDSGNFPSFLKAGGDPTNLLEADLIMGIGDGGFGYGEIYTLYPPGSGQTPTLTSSDWDGDVDWAILYGCNLFGDRLYHEGDCPQPFQGGTPNAYIYSWDNALIRPAGSSYCHGILGSSAPLWSWDGPYPQGPLHVQKFADLIRQNNITIVNAYMDAARSGIPDPYDQWGAAALFRNSNINDMLNKVYPDVSGTTMYYTWYQSVNGARTSTTYSATSSNEVVIASAGGPVTVACAIPTERPEVSKITARHDPTVPSTSGLSIASEETDQSGRLHWSDTTASDETDANTSLTQSEAETIASTFLTQTGEELPTDAEVKEVRNRYVMTYDAEAPEATAETHVHTMFLEYGHSYDGIDIATGRRGDQIRVAITGDRVVEVVRYWREIEGPTGPATQVISAADALQTAVDKIPTVIQFPPATGYKITRIQLFYHGLPSEEQVHVLTPAWGFEVDHTLWVYVDAFSGEFLDRLTP